MTTRRKQLGPQFSMEETTAPTADPPAPATAPQPAVAAPAAADGRSAAAVPSRDLTVVPDISDSASKLASKLAGSDKSDTAADSASDGPSIPLSALTTPPPIDPELDLVNLGLRGPRYLAEAIRTQAFLERRTQQDVVLAALRGDRPLSRELLDECRRSATTRTH